MTDMNERDDEAPFPREPWRRLLEDSADVPPETTDARIRAAARRDLAPRGRRWWLPASLAASLVLAVFVVQSQFGTIRRPLIDESDRGEGPAMRGRIVDRERAEEPRARGTAAAERPARRAPVTIDQPQDDYGNEAADEAMDAGGVGPRIGGPERDLKAASELPEETSARSAAPVTGVATRDVAVSAAAREDVALATPPTPEAWYAAIEKLREEGRAEEAARELERLKKAYPGWLEEHFAKQPKP